jgi:hypothetical protein
MQMQADLLGILGRRSSELASLGIAYLAAGAHAVVPDFLPRARLTALQRGSTLPADISVWRCGMRAWSEPVMGAVRDRETRRQG